tara:strand:+ start:1783 stop:2229 length:447 start_codon:yes stop_codon:yes gene_type:complete
LSTVLLLNGPNLNLLGKREPHLYGESTLKEIESNFKQSAIAFGLVADCIQSNSESILIESVHAASSKGTEAIVINPGAYGHTSVALRDAFLGTGLPFVEVHLSNVFAREEFRSRSLLSDIAIGLISGFGEKSYDLGLQAILTYLQKNK